MKTTRKQKYWQTALSLLSTAALFMGLFISGASAASSAKTTTASTKNWTVTLWVARTSTRAGTSIPAMVTIDNRTGHKIFASGCPGVVFETDLGNSKIPNPLSITLALCGLSVVPGVHVFHTKVITTYDGCGGTTSPKCGKPPRMSPLPAGTYHTQTVWLGAKPSLPTPQSITITLTH